MASNKTSNNSSVGIIGFGSMGARHTANIQELYPSAAIDILTDRRVKMDISENIRMYSSQKQFYARPHDIFFITNETSKHARTVLACLQYNPKGIFVEKPLSHTLRQVEAIRKAVEQQGIVFFVGYCLQFFAPLIFLKKLLREKKIGDILSMRVSAGKDLRKWRSGDYRKRYSSDKKKGGGVVLDLIHEINYPAWLLDEEISYAKGLTGKISRLQITSEDIAEGIFASKSGKIISIHLDYMQVPGRRYCEIVGTKGTLIWEKILIRGSAENEIKIYVGEKLKITHIQAGGNDMYREELKFFMRQVHEGNGYSNLAESIRDLRNALALKAHANIR